MTAYTRTLISCGAVAALRLIDALMGAVFNALQLSTCSLLLGFARILGGGEILRPLH